MSDKKVIPIGGGGGTSESIVVDDALSTSSTNPVQNKVITSELNNKPNKATTLSGYGITNAYTKTEVDNKVAGVINSAPETLDTLKELANALGNDANFATTVTTQIGKKANTEDLAKVATSGSYNDLSNKPTIPTIPSSLPANGGNADTVNGHTVLSDVPANAKFTDTIYSHPATHPASIITGLSTVATSGSYNDLSDKPTIPSAYTLPNATSSTLGGVKVGTNISVSSGTISVADGSTSAKGVVQLSSSTSSTSTSLAATASAVKSAYDLANGKQSPATTLAGYGITNAYTKTEVDAKIPTSLPANGGNAATVGGFTVGTNVPADAKFTDTVYTLPTASSSTLGGVKTTSTVTSTSGLTACPIISGVPYYKDTNNTYTLSSFGVTATATELNVLDGITATVTELNYCDGVTSNIQAQLNGKLSTSGTAAKATADANGNNIVNTYATKAALSTGLNGKADKKAGVYYIEGTGDTAGVWLGTNDEITEYYSGLTVAYKPSVAGASELTLNINNLGAVPVVRNVSSAVTTHYGVDSIVMLTYTVDDGTAYWKIADYDSDTKTRSSNKSGTKMYIIGAQTQSTSGQTTYSNSKCYIGTDNCLYSNGSKVALSSDVTGKADIATTLSGYGITDAYTKTEVDNKVTGFVKSADLATVATSGSYNDLNNKPTIPAYSTGNSTTAGITKLYTSTGTNTDGTMTQSAIKTALDGKLSTAGGNITGHLYLTGAQASSSTGNTSQIVFGTSTSNHVCISSNEDAIVINKSLTETTNQIVLYLDKASQFPNGIAGNASSATKLNSNAGSETQPIYFSGGKPVACSYSLGKSVPSDAKFTDTTYSAATTSAAGLMSAADKTKLDGIATNANNYTYTLPAATSSVLGGVKVGTNIDVSSGTISVANGSTSAKGVVQLTNSTSSTSTTTAATPASVKSAYDLANGKQSPATTLSGYGITDAYTKTSADSNFVGWNRGAFNADELYDGGVYMIAQGTNVPSGSKYGSLLVMPYRQLTGNTKTDFGTQIFIPNGDDSTNPNSMFFRTSLGASWNAWQEVATRANVYTKAEVDSLVGKSLGMKAVGNERSRASNKPNYGL